MNKLNVLITSAIVSMLISPLTAQHTNAVWVTGGNNAIDFSSGTPLVLPNSHQHPDAHAAGAISSANGQLLLYASTYQLFNGQHTPIIGGDSLIGSPQSGLSMVFPKGAAPARYITARYRSATSPWNDRRIYYDEVDLAASGGQGAAIFKNRILRDSLVACMAGIPHANGTDHWLLTHDWGSDQWLTFLINDQGLDTIPNTSSCGEMHWALNGTSAQGRLITSPTRTKIALGKNRYGNFDWRLELYDFDPSTGIVSNPVRLADSLGWFGMEFSPSGQYLYAGERGCSAGFLSKVFQYDISSGDSATIVNSKQLVSTHVVQQGCVTAHGEMLLGPDGKIYVARTLDLMMDVIQFPDMPGASCGYDAGGLPLGSVSSALMPKQIKFPSETTVGVRPHYMNEARLHPNPFHTTARLHLPRAPHGPVLLHWHDARGRLLRTERHGPLRVIDLQRGDLPTGLLLLSVCDDHGTLARLKVVVE